MSTQSLTISTTSIERLLKACLFTPAPHGWGLPILMWGSVGVAKTSVIESLCRKWGLSFESLVGSIIEPMDVAGMQLPSPIKAGQTPTMVQYPAQWVSRANAAGGHVQLLDELTTCPRAVQGAMLRLVFERKAGEVRLNPRVRFLAAANPLDQAANATDIETPLANRFGHVEVTAPDSDAWSDWLLGGAEYDALPADPKVALDEEARVMENWDREFSSAAALVSGFIRRRQGLLNDPPKANDPKAGLAFPTPRTWEMATRALAASAVHGLSADERALLIASFVGMGPANELLDFVRKTDLPDPEMLLDKKVNWKHQANRADRTFAVLASITSYMARAKTDAGGVVRDEKALAKDEKFIARLRACFEIVVEVARVEADVAYPALARLVRAGLDYRIDKEGLQKYMAEIHPIASKIGGR